MLFDWFTVVAQGVNFLILIWLMKRFLYGPIVKAIDERQQGIARSLSEAAANKLQAEEERSLLQQERATLEKKSQGLLEAAMASAEKERKMLLEKAQKDADELTRKRMESLRSQEQKLEEAFHRRAQHEAISLARRVLQELADTDLEERLVEVFVRRLKSLDAGPLQTLVKVGKEGRGCLLIRSAFELSGETRRSLEQSIDELLGGVRPFEYEVVPRLLVGLELVAEGHKVPWSGDELLEKVETRTRRTSSQANPH